MASGRIWNSVVDVTEIFVHWYAGRSINEVSASLDLDRKTIRKYLAPAVAAGLRPGGAAMTVAEIGAVQGDRWGPENFGRKCPPLDNVISVRKLSRDSQPPFSGSLNGADRRRSGCARDHATARIDGGRGRDGG